MALTLHARGTRVRVSVVFTDVNGASVDPTTVRVKWRAPGGAATTWTYGTDAEVVRDSAGNYHADLDTSTAPGIWRYRWESTGAGQAAAESQFTVSSSALD